MNNLIPKIIHFVWVGTKDKPKLVNDCIDSWKRFCPDYEIMEWNNESLKDINNLYVKQAFENHKYAFVSDFIRLYALKKYGGFYFDTDLELTNYIDKFRIYNFVTGYELYDGVVHPITAFMGTTPENNVVNALLEEYNNVPFIKNGIMDETTNTIRITKYFSSKYAFNKPYSGDNTTVLEDKIVIFPYYFFFTPENNKENYAIHHFNGSWIDPYVRKNLFIIGDYKLVRYKRRPNVEGSYMPLLSNEKKVYEFSIFENRKYCILKNV